MRCVCAFGRVEGAGERGAAALEVIFHRCYSSPPTVLLAVNSACSHAPGCNQNDTLSVGLPVYFWTRLSDRKPGGHWYSKAFIRQCRYVISFYWYLQIKIIIILFAPEAAHLQKSFFFFFFTSSLWILRYLKGIMTLPNVDRFLTLRPPLESCT